MGGEKSSPEAAVQSGAKPRTRQRVYKAPPALDVPDIEDDAAERKRVLQYACLWHLDRDIWANQTQEKRSGYAG